jgi:uncharacterized small protein (DUF1192 family)
MTKNPHESSSAISNLAISQAHQIEEQRKRIAELEAEIKRLEEGEAMKNAAGKTHGVDCPKVQHGLPQNFSYLHPPDYDGPYTISVHTWCGRCHEWLPEAEE